MAYDALTGKHYFGVAVCLCWTEEELEELQIVDAQIEEAERRRVKHINNSRRWAAENQEHIVNYRARYRQEHREELNAKRRAYYQAHREQEDAYNREHKRRKREERANGGQT